MSKKKLLKFIVGDRVTFKNEIESQHFGFYTIHSIEVVKENIRYVLSKTNLIGEEELVDGLYSEDELKKVQEIQPRSAHKLHKHQKKRERILKNKRNNKPVINDEMLLYKAILGYKINGKIFIETANVHSQEEFWNNILSKHSDAEFSCYQVIDIINQGD